MLHMYHTVQVRVSSMEQGGELCVLAVLLVCLQR